jgi:L-histidine N-alpha-methyltransferase
MDRHADCDIVELGAGGNRKIRILLDANKKSNADTLRYLPMDVSESALATSSEELIRLYGDLKIINIVADFTRQLDVIPHGRRKLILFLGGTIGNLNAEECLSFLRHVAQVMIPGDSFIIGLDVVKDSRIIELAYNDSQGVTAEFNKNILQVLNTELKADFSLSDFDHLAFYNEKDDRVEMHLKAKRALKVDLAGLNLTVNLTQGETIRTEISRKFSRQSAEKMFAQSNMRVNRWYSDPKEWFYLAELTLRDY